jgi:hypothetical protein
MSLVSVNEDIPVTNRIMRETPAMLLAFELANQCARFEMENVKLKALIEGMFKKRNMPFKSPFSSV